MNKVAAVLATWLAAMVFVSCPAADAAQYGARQRPASTQPAGVPDSLLALPTPGHPLNSRDVDILTGKADRQARTIYPRASAYLPVYATFNGAQFWNGRGTAGFRARFAPRLSPFFAGPRLGQFTIFGGFDPALGFINPRLAPFHRR